MSGLIIKLLTYLVLSTNSHGYTLYTTREMQREAKQNCADVGGLARPKNEAERTTLFNTMSTDRMSEVWIGLEKIVNDWRWGDGSLADIASIPWVEKDSIDVCAIAVLDKKVMKRVNCLNEYPYACESRVPVHTHTTKVPHHDQSHHTTTVRTAPTTHETETRFSYYRLTMKNNTWGLPAENVTVASRLECAAACLRHHNCNSFAIAKTTCFLYNVHAARSVIGLPGGELYVRN